MTLIIYLITLFTSSCLLFLLEPMVGKMILPLFGGTPILWNTCVMFFQFILLVGYFYSHFLTKIISKRIHAALHILLLILPVFFLPVALNFTPSLAEKYHPMIYVLCILIGSVSVPFFVLSTTGPLLQKWFSDLGNVDSKSPYFMYVASNVGSLIPLILYPTMIEPNLSLDIQNKGWAYGFWLFAILASICSIIFIKKIGKEKTVAIEEGVENNVDRPILKQKLIKDIQ